MRYWLTLLVFPGLLLGPLAQASESITIYPAKTIITMNDAQPRAEAIAVSGGEIIAVGSEAELVKLFEAKAVSTDRRFSDKVIAPGFIDNHLHPFLAAIVLRTDWITPQPWNIKGHVTPATRSHDAYVSRMRQRVGEGGADTPYITWGFHELWHGHVDRMLLDEIAPDRPVVIIQRSFHEFIMNSAALRWLQFDEIAPAPPDTDFKTGIFSERGIDAALTKLVPYFFQPEALGRSLDEIRDIVHRGGITTIGDMGVGGYLGITREMELFRASYSGDDTPFRMFLVVAPTLAVGDVTLEDVESFAGRSSDKIRIGRHAKFFADGGFFAQNMKMNPPGYLDGHEGKWMTPPPELAALIEPYWKAGYQIHVHVNGDAGLDVVLDIADALQAETPLADHRFSLHHVGISTPAQVERAAELGMVVSAQPNYVWALADKYSEHGLGPERASTMVRLGSMVRSGMKVSLHSDFTMAPAAPLTLASIAVNRLTAKGNLMAPAERLTVHEALAAITIDAAYMLRMENEIGSIEVGKKADLTILEQNPYEVAPERLADIPIWGTMYGGGLYPIREDEDLTR